MKQKLFKLFIFLFSILYFSCKNNDIQNEELVTFFSEQYELRKDETYNSLEQLKVKSKEQPNQYSVEKEEGLKKKYIEKLDIQDPLLEDKERAFRLYTDFFEETKFPRKTIFKNLEDFENLDKRLVILKLKLDVMTAFYQYLDSIHYHKYYSSFRNIEKIVASNPKIESKLIKDENENHMLLLGNDKIFLESFTRFVSIDKIENQKEEIKNPKVQISNVIGHGFIPLDSLPKGKHQLKGKVTIKSESTQFDYELDTILEVK
ncbi:hypothetical protein [Aureivirga marina]|uniref:hypothetical protein n=1 Tax=Aureivirga marina TaxID=1182451 RepID=UPI0018CAD76B|nr:hypothetical protein [Aureivirga marina]